MSFKRRSLTLALKALATVAHSVGWRGCAHGIKNRERFFRPFCITSAFSPGAAGAGAACVVAQDDATPSTATSPMRRFAVGDATCALRAGRDRGSYGRGSNHPNHVQQPTGHGRADRPSTGTHQTRRRKCASVRSDNSAPNRRGTLRRQVGRRKVLMSLVAGLGFSAPNPQWLPATPLPLDITSADR